MAAMPELVLPTCKLKACMAGAAQMHVCRVILSFVFDDEKWNACIETLVENWCPKSAFNPGTGRHDQLLAIVKDYDAIMRCSTMGGKVAECIVSNARAVVDFDCISRSYKACGKFGSRKGKAKRAYAYLRDTLLCNNSVGLILAWHCICLRALGIVYGPQDIEPMQGSTPACVLGLCATLPLPRSIWMISCATVFYKDKHSGCQYWQDYVVKCRVAGRPQRLDACDGRYDAHRASDKLGRESCILKHRRGQRRAAALAGRAIASGLAPEIENAAYIGPAGLCNSSRHSKDQMGVHPEDTQRDERSDHCFAACQIKLNSRIGPILIDYLHDTK